uniref:Uncharacterized protein n=1 Tax=Ciona savignyi TaxID=51511 RepID=H2YHD2_CIOSA
MHCTSGNVLDLMMTTTEYCARFRCTTALVWW